NIEADWAFFQRLGLFTAIALLISWFQEVRRRAENAANEQAYRSAATLASIADAVIATDTQARITTMNHIAEALTGWVERDAKGVEVERVLNLISADTRQPINESLSTRLSRVETARSSKPTLLIGRTGDETAIEDYNAPIKDRHGKLIGAIVVFRDVTERRK